MDFYELTDSALAVELGRRIKALRLEKNLTQVELSNATMLSLNVIKSLESGRGKLASIIAILRELKALDHLNNFIPEVRISPLQLAKMQGKVRKRASRKKGEE